MCANMQALACDPMEMA